MTLRWRVRARAAVVGLGVTALMVGAVVGIGADLREGVTRPTTTVAVGGGGCDVFVCARTTTGCCSDARPRRLQVFGCSRLAMARDGTGWHAVPGVGAGRSATRGMRQLIGRIRRDFAMAGTGQGGCGDRGWASQRCSLVQRSPRAAELNRRNADQVHDRPAGSSVRSSGGTAWTQRCKHVDAGRRSGCGLWAGPAEAVTLASSRRDRSRRRIPVSGGPIPAPRAVAGSTTTRVVI